MKITQKLTLLLSATFFFVSCGVPKHPGSLRNTVLMASTGDPIPLKHEDQGCLEKPNFETMFSTSLYINGNYTIPFEAPALNRYTVKEFFIAGQMRVEEKIYSSTDTRSSSLRITDKGQSFVPCVTNHDYKSDTYQSAGESVAYTFNGFEQSIAEFIKKNNIPKVNVRIAPEAILTENFIQGNDVYIRENFLVNNAFYYPDTSDITFLPQGRNENGKIPFNGVPMWKIPMIAIHEYGHHLFSNLVGRNMQEKHKVKLCWNFSEESHQSVVVSSVSKLKESDITRTYNSLNEGMADLISHYANAFPGTLKDIGCMERSRDVESSIFYKPEAKKLNRSVIDIFTSSTPLEKGTCDKVVNYQDTHIIGAIFAHGFDKLLAGLGVQRQQKLLLVLNWLKTVRPQWQMRNMSTAESTLRYFSSSFYQFIAKRFSVTRKTCSDYQDIFPESGLTCR